MKRITKTNFQRLLEAFDFRTLFNELGWDNDSGSSNISVDNVTYPLRHVSNKGGFKILHCETAELPDYATRRKIDTQATRLFRDHIIIFSDTKKTHQIWLLVVREPGKPARTSETHWRKGQAPELLFQRASGLFFTLEEEGISTNILDVKERVTANFAANAEKVTKKFYEQFRKEHQAFMGFIEGIGGQGDREWYASLMLNRLMFCYFIQKKDFLDRNKNYLRDKLKHTEEKRGKNKFYSFYRDFLLALFHNGLGDKKRPDSFEKEFGRIPYLNGGLFDVHELEKNNAAIQISDEAFVRLFDFFDQYEWHLDNRPVASGKDINPDVIGYIFEKYINDRADMGAYYTKEDITEYISKSCILPYLFDETQRKSKKDVFADLPNFQSLVNLSPDRYIFEAVRKGVDLPLPEGIAEGLDTTKPNLLERRKNWNKATPEAYALPTEIWRETIERRQRCERLRQALRNGEVRSIEDFVTLNLDIRQFAQDAIENTGDPDWLRHFFNSLRSVTVLDPTCGSGAFLFAALNILEPLYEACLLRIRSFVEEAPKGKYKTFEDILSEIERPEHPNEQYYIHKSIILQNLYGVDIMREAVEIAKLRLFLRLAATVDADYSKDNLGLEPLPDVDFNIRAGNTLVGYATLQEAFFNIKRKEGMFAESKLRELETLAIGTGLAYKRFQDFQTVHNPGSEDLRNSKRDLERRMKELNNQLSRYLALSYLPPDPPEKLYADWLESHKPFHWCTEFYRIIEEGKGFDVVIGNPPYVEYSKVKSSYSLFNYKTLESGNLFAFVIERSVGLQKKAGFIGLIIPISSFSTERMESLQFFGKNELSSFWLSSYGIRPTKLFEGAEQRLTIIIGKRKNDDKKQSAVFSAKYHRWYQEERPALFKSIAYQNIYPFIEKIGYPKVSTAREVAILKMMPSAKLVNNFNKLSTEVVLWHRIPGYFIKALDFTPYFFSDRDGIKKSEDYKPFGLRSKDDKPLVLSILNSSLFYWFWFSISDGYHCGKHEVLDFRVDFGSVSEKTKVELKKYSEKLMIEMKENSNRRVRNQKTTNVEYDEFYPSKSKPLIDQIDTVLARHYGFTEEELDYVINYDIKYRMGGAEEED